MQLYIILKVSILYILYLVYICSPSRLLLLSSKDRLPKWMCVSQLDLNSCMPRLTFFYSLSTTLHVRPWTIVLRNFRIVAFCLPMSSHSFPCLILMTCCCIGALVPVFYLKSMYIKGLMLYILLKPVVMNIVLYTLFVNFFLLLHVSF